MKVLLIEPGKPPRPAIIPQTLAAMQKAVGGLIQAVYPFDDPVALICNEEAKLEGLPLNRALRDEDGNIYDIIAGTFFLCGAPPDSEDFTFYNVLWRQFLREVLGRENYSKRP